VTAPHIVGGYGRCQHCEHDGPVKTDGTMRKHKETTWGRPCAGAGKPPRARGAARIDT
jgi:hypothetical protein